MSIEGLTQKDVTDNLLLQSLNVGSNTPLTTTTVTISNGPPAYGQPSAQLYKFDVLSSGDELYPNDLQIVSQPGGPSQAVAAVQINPAGMVSFPAGVQLGGGWVGNSEGINQLGSTFFLGGGSAGDPADPGFRCYSYSVLNGYKNGFLYSSLNPPKLSPTQFVPPGTILAMATGRASANTPLPIGNYLVSFKVAVTSGNSFAAADSLLISMLRQDTVAPVSASYTLAGVSTGQGFYEGVGYLNVATAGQTFAAWLNMTGAPALVATFSVTVLTIA